MKKIQTVPIWIREIISRVCKFQPMRSLARAIYSLIAKYCANTLSKFPNVQAVYLRGKGTKSSDPGISDLDYWIFLPETELAQIDALTSLQKLYKKLKNRFLLPGKMEVTSRESWELYKALAPATFFEDIPLHQFEQSKFLAQISTASEPVRTLSRFNLGMYNYVQALDCIFSAAAEKDAYYHLAIFKKFIEKAHRALGDETTVVYADVSPAQLLANIFLLLHSVAQQAENDATTALPTTFSILDTSRKSVGDSSAVDRIASHLNKLNIGVQRILTEKYLLWNELKPDAQLTTLLFENILKLSPSNAASLQDSHCWPITLVSPQIAQCLWRGTLLGPLLENLSHLSQYAEADLGKYMSDVLLCLFDRLVMRLNHNLGVVVSYEKETFLKPLLYQCFELLVVHSRHVTNDVDLLCKKYGEDCPKASYWLRRLTKHELPLNNEEWLGAYIQVRNESIPVIRNFANYLATS